jgi:hypothetical protein
MSFVDNMPRDILTEIYKYLCDEDVINIASTCKRFRADAKGRELTGYYKMNKIEEYEGVFKISNACLYQIDRTTIEFIKKYKITRIKFGNHFNQNLDTCNLYHEHGNECCILPDCITNVIFGHGFNQRIKKLPDSIIHLEFGSDFNRRIDKNNMLPQKLEYLKLGDKFGHKIDVLPDTLKVLEIDKNYRWSNSLKELSHNKIKLIY